MKHALEGRRRQAGGILCICGTDTDAGKTVVTAGLLRAALGLGFAAQAVKPVQTGGLIRQARQAPSGQITLGQISSERTPSGQTASGAAEGELAAPDVLVYRRAAPGARAFALHVLEEACSPHLAAARAGLELSAAALAREVRAAAVGAQLTLVETAGGLLAPLNERECMADILVRLGAPVLLVAANRLGAVNQALLSLEALRGRGIEPCGLVLTETVPRQPARIERPEAAPNPAAGTANPAAAAGELQRLILEDNARSIPRFGGLPLLAQIPYLKDLERICPEASGPESSGPEASGPESCGPKGSGPEASSSESAERSAWGELARILEPVLKSLPESLGPLPEPSAERSAPAAAALAHPAAADTAAIADRAEDLSSRLEFDRHCLWHPYTSALTPLKCREAFKTEGPYIWLRELDERGQARPRRVLDGMASWWSAIHGYNHPRLLAALRRQAEEMPHVMFGGLTHAPAVELGKKLLELAPADLRHVFLADSGSVAVEVALKMAVQYQRAVRGKAEKSRILTVRGGYHGDTLGAMSVCDPVNGMHGLFSGLLPEQIFAPRPACRFEREFDPESLKPVRELFAARQREIAAVIIEPVVQGAGGMWFYHPEYLRGLKELCQEYGALLILDEIATGFGRTGRMFACEWAGIQPDIMCVGKALTGGVLTLAATLASREVACGISAGGGVLMHGPTFMGNPLACAVAVASLSLLSAGPWQSRVAEMERVLKTGLEPCRGLEGVSDVRVLGAIGVVEMEEAVNVERLQDFFVRERGVWLRPFGRLIYIMPPYVTPRPELEKLAAAIRAAVEGKKWA